MIFISKPIANLVQRMTNLAKFLRSKNERKENIDQEIKIQGHKKIEELRHQASHISMTDLSLHL